MFAPEPVLPLSGLTPGRFGAPGAAPVRITVRQRALVQLTARRGQGAVLAEAIRDATGLTLPPPGRASTAGDLGAVWVQPDGWLIGAPPGREGALAETLRTAAGGLGAVVDQTHGRTVLTVSGPETRRVLAKGCRIDLHPSVFKPGDAAITSIAQVGVVLFQADAAPTYGLIVFATLAASFVESLMEMAAGSGYEIA